MNKFAIVGLTGFSICAICLGAALALGSGSVNGMDLSFLGGRPACKPVAGATGVRDLDWDGSDHVDLSMAGHATYTPGSNTKMHVTGDPQTVAHIVVHDGDIEMDCNEGWNSYREGVNITLPGRAFRQFSVSGSSDLALSKLNQDRLKVSISGSGSVRGDGHVDEAEIHISGSGETDFGHVTGRVARVHISGSGDADIAPTDTAEVHVSGSGDVNLHSSPRTVESHISGSGSVHNMGT